MTEVMMCRKCLATITNDYWPERKRCPFCRHGLFEVDDLIAEPVRILNRKGYITRFTCSGHVCRDDKHASVEDWPLLPVGTYIVFAKRYTLPPCPGFQIRDNWCRHTKVTAMHSLGWPEDEVNDSGIPNPKDRFIRVMANIATLWEWADELPRRE